MTDDVHPLIARARAIAPDLAALAARHEAERQLAPEAIVMLRDGGMLASLLPEELGGHAIAPSTYVAMLAELATGDTATAWCTMTASTSTLLAAYLDRAEAATIWSGAPTPFMAGVFAPTGTATPADDGMQLTGRWSYASGSRHAEWFALGALVAGERRHVTCVVAARDVRIVDNWDTLGLAGTGSHDIVVEGALIPASRIATVFGRAPWPGAPLYRIPLFGVLALGVAACAVGAAGAALAHVATRLRPTGKSEAPSSGLLTELARQHAAHAGARAYLIATTRAAESAAAAGAVPDAMRGELRLAAATVAATSASITRAAFHLGGGASIRAGSPLGRALRDAETILTHRMVADRVLPAAARAILGIGLAPPDL
jgi:alkylation response protein AidB-like acyl-CoA dehydrogenase